MRLEDLSKYCTKIFKNMNHYVRLLHKNLANHIKSLHLLIILTNEGIETWITSNSLLPKY